MKKRHKVMLDTTYLMPLFGIETEKFSASQLQILLGQRNLDLFYSPVSLVELKWIILKQIKKVNNIFKKTLLSRYNEALWYLLYGEYFYELPLIDPRINTLEGILRDLGLNDYFDRIIFAAALEYCDILLTEDTEIHDIWLSQKEKLTDKEFRVLSWMKFKQFFL